MTHALASPSDIRQFYTALEKHVISFAGFGELGYEQEGVIEWVAHEVLRQWHPEDLAVNVGTLLRVGGHDGIAEILAIADSMGIITSGIHPSIALDFADTHRVSPYEHHNFFVQDETWGGFVGSDQKPSTTLQTILEISDELVVVGGGKHAADELLAFLRSGKRVRYFPAEMNHATTIEWCQRAGVTISDFRGEAYHTWLTKG